MTRLEALTKAAEDFIAKVDRGEAKSVRSYNAFKQALNIPLPKEYDGRWIDPKTGEKVERYGF